MAISPGPRRGATDETNTPRLDPMQEPIDSLDRPGYRTSDDNDVNLDSTGTHRVAGNLGTTGTPERRGGFTATFAIIAAELLIAFLVAIWFGAERSNVATAPTTTPPVADNSTSSDTTGSTTPVPSQEPAPPPAPATDATGTGSTAAPANP